MVGGSGFLRNKFTARLWQRGYQEVVREVSLNADQELRVSMETLREGHPLVGTLGPQL